MIKTDWFFIGKFRFFCRGSILVSCLFTQAIKGQQALPLSDLSAFKTPGKTWKTGSAVVSDFSKANDLSLTDGSGVLANLPSSGGADLYTSAEYGDMDLELEYLMAKGSNSGIYLQGQYEVQLMDSWGNKNPTPGDNGGIYQRWDESRPAGQFGYEGYAPRQNASKAPGLWQQLRISFQAPRFDASGKKIENAKFLRIELNGVTIHENAELSGPTRGAMENNERPTGPLRFQGDHGPVAFRNIKVTPLDKPHPQFSNIKYSVFRGRFYDTLDLKKLPPEAQGTLNNLSATSIQNVPSEYFIRYTGTVTIKESGDYAFNLAVPGGRGIMRINNQSATPQGGGRRQGGASINLPAGELPFELLYAKNQDWTNRSLNLTVAGPGIREYSVGDVVAASAQNTDPILVDAPVNTVLRSFMDLPDGARVVHAVSVGSPDKVHYTYDMDRGAIIQAWRGGFLDATPMWYSRGDGSSRPVGAVQRFGKPQFTVAKLASVDAAWPTDSVVSDFLPKGYQLNKVDVPAFRYLLGGAMVQDSIIVLNNGEGLSRDITLKNATGNYYARIAGGSTIKDAGKGLYIIDGQSYYLRIDDAGGATPVIRDENGGKVLIVPVQQRLRYSIIF
jgi:hypothetical protein